MHKHHVGHLLHTRSCIRHTVPHVPELRNRYVFSAQLRSVACATKASCDHWSSSLPVYFCNDFALCQHFFVRMDFHHKYASNFGLLCHLPCSSRRWVLHQTLLGNFLWYTIKGHFWDYFFFHLRAFALFVAYLPHSILLRCCSPSCLDLRGHVSCLGKAFLAVFPVVL